MGADTLLIIPCCAAKDEGGQSIREYPDPLRQKVSEKHYSDILTARATALHDLKETPKFSTHAKNLSLREGLDFGGKGLSGAYLTAMCRYTGNLYSVPELKTVLEKAVSSASGPQIIILSALYGPLHPLSKIQNYNLKMSDRPAKIWSSSFLPFLKDYVLRNSISAIYLYLGSSTQYFRVAAKAAVELKDRGIVSQVIQYHVVNGNTRETPQGHGYRLLFDLTGRLGERSQESVEIEKKIL